MPLGNLASLRYFLPELAITATILLLVVAHVAGRNRRASAPALVIFMSIDCYELTDRTQAEYYLFLLSVLLGMFLLSSASDIVMLYLALELVSIPSYLLAGYLKGKASSTEASMKYVVYGATASGVMIYGFSLLYGMTGSTQISEIGRVLTLGTAPLPAMLAAVMVTVGFGYKIAAVPFHMWSPDVYGGPPTPVTAFLSVGPKAAGFAVLVRFFYTVFASPDGADGMWKLSSSVDWAFLLAVVANGSRSEDISDFSGLGSRAPFAAVSLAIFLFALTGIPPFSGFIGKVYLFAEVIDRGVYWLALVAAINSVVSLYYYARIVKVMFLEDPKESAELSVPAFPRALLCLLVIPTLVLGVYWEPVIRVAANSVKLLVF